MGFSGVSSPLHIKLLLLLPCLCLLGVLPVERNGESWWWNTGHRQAVCFILSSGRGDESARGLYVHTSICALCVSAGSLRMPALPMPVPASRFPSVVTAASIYTRKANASAV